MSHKTKYQDKRDKKRKTQKSSIMNKRPGRNSMKLLILLLICLVFILPIIAAADNAYLPLKQNNPFELVISSNNATQCNLSYIQYADGNKSLFNLPMTKTGQTFNITVAGGNNSILGGTCYGMTCTDSVGTQTGSVCRNITPQGDSQSGWTIAVQIFASISCLFLMLLFLFLASTKSQHEKTVGVQEEQAVVRFFFVGLSLVFLIAHILFTSAIISNTLGEGSTAQIYSYIMKAFFTIIILMFVYISMRVIVNEVHNFQKRKGLRA